MGERYGSGPVPGEAIPKERSDGTDRAEREKRALGELWRAISAIEVNEVPERDLAADDAYFEFQLDQRVAAHCANMLVIGMGREFVARIADALPFGQRQLHDALVSVLADRLADSRFSSEHASGIDWPAIAEEDPSVLSDARLHRGIATFVGRIVSLDRDEVTHQTYTKSNDGVPYFRRQSKVIDRVVDMLDLVPSVANDVLTKMLVDGFGNAVCLVLEHPRLHLRGVLDGKLALGIQHAQPNFLDEGNLGLFTGLTEKNLSLLEKPGSALSHVSSFVPEAQNWIVDVYLSGRSPVWDTERFDKKLLDQLPEMAHLDQRALAAMRLRGLVPDRAWAAGLPPYGEGVTELLRLLDDPAFPEEKRQSDEFLEAMHAGVVKASLKGKHIPRAFVRAVAFARETYKVSPGQLTSIFLEDAAFFEQAPNDDRTGPAIVAWLRRLAASERAAAGGPLSQWGAVDTDSPLIAGNTTDQIADRMERFGTRFGWATALKFSNRAELSYHDAFLCVDELERFSEERSDVTNRELAQLLDQVARDDASYDGWPSQAHVRFVLTAIGSARVEDVRDRVERLNVPSLAERVAKLFDDPRFHPYKTWKGLKEFSAIVDVLNKNQALEALADPRVPESTKRFGHALLEHPNVPAKDVLKFLSNPTAFLSAKGTYTKEEVQEHMAPINLARVERLGLSAANVRDAVADGSLDRLQVLPAFERTFAMDAHGTDPRSPAALQAALLRALGRRERPVDLAPEGESAALVSSARDVKRLFAAVQAAFDRHGIAPEIRKPWLLGEAMMVPAYWTDALADDLYRAAYDKAIGIIAPSVLEVRVRIGKKSDPSLIVAGNDTASCMPFGDGKTNVYAWSPACAQLVVERKTSDGSWRTMAQSVVMPTLAGNDLAPERFSRLLGGERVHEVFAPEEFARPPVILCDNLEPNPNEVQEGRLPVIEAAYRAFFRSYLAEHGEALGVDVTRVVVGKEDYLPTDRLSLPKTPNVYVPLAPISYSDNNATESYVIETGLPSVETRPRTGIQEATGADIMAMAYLEGKGFQDNDRMVFGLYDRQQRVTAALISREQHGDPGLTLVSRDATGEPTGYMLAYVARASDVPEVYIDDFAVDRSKNLLAARHASNLLEEFLNRYVGHYASRGEPFPSIFAQMREETSYRLMVGQLRKLSGRHGILVEPAEEGIGTLGDERMHHVRLFVGRNDAEVAEAKRQWNERAQKPSDTWSSDQENSDGERSDDDWDAGWDDGGDW